MFLLLYIVYDTIIIGLQQKHDILFTKLLIDLQQTIACMYKIRNTAIRVFA